MSQVTTQPLLTSLALLCLAGSGAAQTPSGETAGGVPGLEIRLVCSAEKPRTIVAELTLQQRRGVERVPVEVTTYKDGFATRTYARLSDARSGQRFELEAPRSRTPAAIAGLDLVVVGVETTRDPDTSLLRVEGLEPGLNYFWRLGESASGSRTPTEAVRLAAPVCPADFQPEPQGS